MIKAGTFSTLPYKGSKPKIQKVPAKTITANTPTVLATIAVPMNCLLYMIIGVRFYDATGGKYGFIENRVALKYDGTTCALVGTENTVALKDTAAFAVATTADNSAKTAVITVTPDASNNTVCKAVIAIETEPLIIQ